MRQETVTTKQIRDEITKLQDKWYLTAREREELRRLRKHYYQKNDVFLREKEIEMQNS